MTGASGTPAYAKASPGMLRWGSPGTGSNPYIGMEMFKAAAHIDVLHVPYRGTGPALTDLVAGQIDVLQSSVASTGAYLANGRVRVLAVAAQKRVAALPNVPTLKELYGIVANSPWGIGGPKGMDPKVVKVLHDAFKRAAEEPAFLKVLERFAMEPYYMAGEEYARWVRRAYEEEKRAVERLGLNK